MKSDGGQRHWRWSCALSFLSLLSHMVKRGTGEGRGREGGGTGEDRLLEELVSWDLFPSLHSQPLPPGSFTNDNGEVRSFMFHLHGATYRVVGAAGDGWSEKPVE